MANPQTPRPVVRVVRRFSSPVRQHKRPARRFQTESSHVRFPSKDAAYL